MRISDWSSTVCSSDLIGLLGNATIFAPLMANTTRWFDRNRGLALGIVASGQSVGGTIWPPIARALDADIGWRETVMRSEARSVGKEGGSTCRSRGSPSHLKNQTTFNHSDKHT